MEAAMRPVTLVALIATALPAIVPAKAQETPPAVDGLSGKLSFGRGSADGKTWTGLEGAVTVPLGNRFGLQLDVAGGRLDASPGNPEFYGTGAHVFWRDPSLAMIGVEAGVMHLDAFGGVTTYSAGIEAERYWSTLTLGGLVGVTGGSDVTVSTPLGRFQHDLKTRFVAATNLTWYPDENLALSVSGALSGDDVAGGIGVEWAPPTQNAVQPSLFARAVLREGGDLTALAGLNLYFGQKPKPLIRRHREDDPAIGNVASLGSKAGIAFTIGAIMKFRQHKQNPPQ
jgi:hypothetical protein